MKLHRATRLVFASAALAAPALLAPSAVRAQAFGLNEIGSCALARGFATTASPCKDASAIFWNPAATTSLTGWTVSAGVAAIDLNGSFTQDTTFRKYDMDVATQWVPHLFVNYHKPDDKWAAGLGFYVPYGLTAEWTDDFPGRFSARKASLQTFYVQPNFAWKFSPNWSVGGGPIWGHSSVELIQGVDLSTQVTSPATDAPTFGMLGIAEGTEFARARLKGSSNAFGLQIGVQGKLTPDWSFGARFLTPVTFDYDDGTVTFTQVPTGLLVGGTLSSAFVAGTPIDAIVAPQFQSGNPLTEQAASTKITHPAQAQLGFAYSGFRDWMLEADYAWIGWKRFDVLPITFAGPASGSSRTLIESYNNSSAIRLGAEYTTGYQGLMVRAGFAGAASAAPPETVTPLLPEQDRTYWTLGLGMPFAKVWAADLTYAFIHTGGARGRLSERSNVVNTNATAAQMNTGVFDLSANILSLTIKASF